MSGAMQVFFQDRLVGELRNPPCRLQDPPGEIAILKPTQAVQKYGLDAGSIGDMIWIPVKTRYQILDGNEVRRAQDISGATGTPSPALFAKFFGIPTYAAKTEDRVPGETRFSWPVLMPGLDEYEILFDLDTFEPA